MSERPIVRGSVSARGARWLAQLPPSMGRRSKIHDTEDQAWQWITAETAKKVLRQEAGPDPGRTPLGALIDVWLERASLKQSTRVDYRIRIDKHIKAHAIAAVPIGDVRGMHVDDALTATPMNWTRIHVSKIMCTFFEWAENNRFTVGNPYRQSQAKSIGKTAYQSVRNEKRESTDNVWAPEQFVTFMEYETDPVYRAYWIFVAATGARRGEAIGMRWENMHLDAGWCLLADNITTAGNEIIHEETPKTWAKRKAYFAPVLGRMFLALKAEQDTYRAQFDTWPSEGWVFDRRRGKGARYFPGVHLAPATVTQRFNRQADELSLPRLAGPHGLRRTFATIAEAEGFKASVRTKAMGHTPDTGGIYTKTTTPELEALAARLADLLVPSGSVE